MKKILVFIYCATILISCKKNTDTPAQIENANQQLTRIIKTTNLSSGPVSQYLDFEYNSAGKIMVEGNKSYVRDEKQRIVQVGTNIPNTTVSQGGKVYYVSPESNKVAYTLYTFADTYYNDVNTVDSIAYVHDATGNLAKLMYYVYHFGETPILYLYQAFDYDNNGNLLALKRFSITNGIIGNCGAYVFSNYDNKVNPLHAADEVRMAEFNMEGAVNLSANNFMSYKNNLSYIDNYGKVYKYRADGRPASCSVLYNGTDAFTLTFEYK
jgi:hypothetical protein